MTLIKVKLFDDLLFFRGRLLPENQLSYLNNEGGSDGKESACKVGDLGSIPGLGRFPGEETGHPLQYSCLGNPMGRGASWATVHGITESDMIERLTPSLFPLK